MTDLWSSLIPLIVGGALVPIQIIVTTLLLRSKAGKVAAAAWVAGMTTLRLAQGLVFGLLLGSRTGSGSTSERTRYRGLAPAARARDRLLRERRGSS